MLKIKNLPFRDNIPPEVEDGIRDSIGRKSVVTLKKMVKLKRQQDDRTDAKVLILTPYHCQLLGIKAPFKLEHDFHFLDIKSMDSPTPDTLVITINHGKVLAMQMIGTDDADHIIGRVALSLRTIFPNVALSRILKASLEPLGRQKLIQTMLNQADQVEPGPCGNFSEMYRCICDYLNTPVREDVEWDVDTIYLSQNCREINFKDFDLLEIKDMIPIISVMIYNRWFDSLVIRDAKITSEALDFILKVARNSHNLKQLSMEGVGLKGDFAQRLSINLVDNKESCLEILDLSNNPIEDKGILHLSGALPLIKHGGVKKLNFSKTGLTPRGINGLCQSLRSSPKILDTLTSLNLSGNWIKGDEAEELINFLSNQNNIIDLDISATDCAVEVLVAALSNSCIHHLESLSIGRNYFYSKVKGKEQILPAQFQKFFKQTTCIKRLDFSGMKLPAEALGSMLDGLQSNNNSELDVELNIASCELKTAGCQVLQKKVSSMKNITKLDVSDNGFDSDLVPLLSALQENRSIRELHIGRNFFGIKTKHLKRTMEAITELIQEEDSCLESLSLADSKIREYIHTFLGCLGSNISLTTLDISGNLFGDGGSRVLAKSIQINSKMKILKLDRNNLTAVGFREIANALEKNYTLRHIPYPVSDTVAAMRSNSDRAHSALTRIQDLLLRNEDVNKGSNEQQFRLQKAVSNTAQKVLDKVAEKVDDAISALEILDADSASSDTVKTAKSLVKDAQNSKQLLSDIYGLATEKAISEGSQLQEKLNKVASDVEQMVQQHLKDSTSAMMRNTEAECSHIFEEIQEELLESTEERCKLPDGSIKDHILKTAGTEIVNKVSELNLTIATLISDRVTDTLLAALSQSNLSLTEQLNKSKERPKPQIIADESDSIDLASDEVDEKVDNFAAQPADVTDDHRETSQNSLLPEMRKERAQSIAKRRQRPGGFAVTPEETERKLSRTGDSPERGTSEDSLKPETEKKEVEADKETNKEQVSGEELDIPVPIEEKDKQEAAEEMDISVSDGPSTNDISSIDEKFPDVVETKTLEHVTKGRPRGPTRRQRKGTSRYTKPNEDKSLDGFFQNNVSNTDFSEVPTAEEEEELKRKERIEEKMATKKQIPGMGGMGAPFITPGMLKTKKKSESSDENEKPHPAEEKEKAEEAPAEKPRRPIGGMGMPGMGFGGNILAEMKLKKLSRKSQDSLEVKSPEQEKPESKKSGSPFGLSALKKRNEESPTKETSNANANNNNNNNNNSGNVSLKEKLLSKIKPKSEKESKKENEKPDISPKAKPLIPSKKPATTKPKPPPLPTKPKPSLLHPNNVSKTRPLSEFFEAKSAAASSNVRTRSVSLKKEEKTDDK